MSTAPSASTINYQVSSREDHWVFTPVCWFKPTEAVIKVNKEKREVSIKPRRPNKDPAHQHVNGGVIKLSSRADMDHDPLYIWKPHTSKDQVMPELTIWKKPLPAGA